MATYFVFSDESGEYQEYYRGKGQKYFVRSALLFNSENWIALKDNIDNLKKNAGIQIFTEFKWRYIHLIRMYQEGKLRIKKAESLYSFKDYNLNTLIDFVRKSISLFHGYADSKIICTFTENVPIKPWRLLAGGIVAMQGGSKNPTIHNIYKWHLQDLMIRIEMEMQNNNLAVLFFDEDNKKTESHLRNSYHEVYHNATFIEEYKHIKDSLCFEDSRHSIGTQISDYIAGIFNAFLNDNNIGYDLMKDCILPILCKDSSGDYLGYGIKEIPTDENKKAFLRQKIKEKLLDGHPTVAQDILTPYTEEDDIPF